MQPFFDQDHFSLRTRARRWVDAHLIATGEQANIEETARRLLLELAKEEFLGYTVSIEYGGKRAKVQARDLCILREELARGSALADALFALQALGSLPLILAGSEEQKRRYLPRVASGAAIAAFALTEPEAGSDAASLQTRAFRRNREYVLSGTKSFISNAGIAAHYLVFASTAPENRGKGISAFIVDADTPGLVVKEKTALISPHPLGVIAFENCVVDADALVGLEGKGL
ncbi:MAG TPA: acyl-CoA dehydrogenase family protein, partial [Candidatus Binatia bacterium]|nr:acyl-CoA dehydrogenase family protein [Candidatus Binatia bacterium]